MEKSNAHILQRVFFSCERLPLCGDKNIFATQKKCCATERVPDLSMTECAKFLAFVRPERTVQIVQQLPTPFTP